MYDDSIGNDTVTPEKNSMETKSAIRLEEFDTSNVSHNSGKHSRHGSKASRKRQKFRILVDQGLNEEGVSDHSIDILQHSNETEQR